MTKASNVRGSSRRMLEKASRVDPDSITADFLTRTSEFSSRRPTSGVQRRPGCTSMLSYYVGSLGLCLL